MIGARVTVPFFVPYIKNIENIIVGAAWYATHKKRIAYHATPTHELDHLNKLSFLTISIKYGKIKVEVCRCTLIAQIRQRG